MNSSWVIWAHELERQAASTELIDYKFHCFNGEFRFLYVSQGLENHDAARISFLTLDWEFVPFARDDHPASMSFRKSLQALRK